MRNVTPRKGDWVATGMLLPVRAFCAVTVTACAAMGASGVEVPAAYMLVCPVVARRFPEGVLAPGRAVVPLTATVTVGTCVCAGRLAVVSETFWTPAASPNSTGDNP